MSALSTPSSTTELPGLAESARTAAADTGTTLSEWISRTIRREAAAATARRARVENDAFGDRRAIAVEIDSQAVFDGVYREPITDASTAYLDRLTWVARSHLVQLIGHLHPDRHTHVTEVIRTLIGNL